MDEKKRREWKELAIILAATLAVGAVVFLIFFRH